MANFKNFFKLKAGKGKVILLLAGLIVAGVVGGRVLFTYAEQFIDSFLDTTRIADTWNIEVDTGAGEVKLAAKSCGGNWLCSASTTCSNTLGDGSYIIVANADASSTKQWKTANTACDTPECGTDGGQDGDQLVADNTVNFLSYPARDYCKSIGGRLPTNSELSCMYTNRATFGNNFGAGYYWSETEYSATTARYVGFTDGNQTSGNKTYTYYVRCVKGW
jgi:hypothetical protein